MLKKINNYHLYILILIVFILNTILFRSIDITKAQWASPGSTPGEQLTNIVVNPLKEDLNLGGNKIFGVGYVGLGITTNAIENPFIVSNNIGDGGIISSFYDPIMGNTDIMHLRIGKDNSVGNAGLLSFYYNGNNSGENYLGLGINNAADTLIITKDGNVGIGTTIPATTLEVAGNMKAGRLFLGADTGGNPAYFLNTTGILEDGWHLSFNHSSDESFSIVESGVSERVTVERGGNVGIGTEQPNKNLHIYDENNAEIDLQSVGVPGDGNHWGIYHDGLSDDLKFWHGNEDRLTITDDGNVGIGVIEPAGKLEVMGGPLVVQDGAWANPAIKFKGTNSYIFNTGSGDNNRTEFVSDGNTSLQIYKNRLMVKNGTQSWPGIAWSDQTNTGIYRNTGATDTYNISFAVGNTTPMTINTTGVGIGTAIPEAKLDVRGNTILGGGNSVNVISATNPRCNEDENDPSGCSSMIGTGLVKGTPGFDYDNSIGGFHPDGAFWASPMIYRSIRAPNNGTGEFPWNNYGELFIQGTSYGSSYNKGISLVTWDGTDADPAIRMRVNEVGNVGIGINNPEVKLDVDGQIQQGGHLVHADVYLGMTVTQSQANSYCYEGTAMKVGHESLGRKTGDEFCSTTRYQGWRQCAGVRQMYLDENGTLFNDPSSHDYSCSQELSDAAAKYPFGNQYWHNLAGTEGWTGMYTMLICCY